MLQYLNLNHADSPLLKLAWPMQALRIQNVTSNLEQSCHDMRTFWPDAGVEYSGRQPYYSNVNGLVLANASFSDNATVPGLMISGLRFDDCHLITIPLAGHSTHQFQGQTYNACCGQAVFQPAGVEITAWPLSHVRTFQVTIDRLAYDDVVQGYVGHHDLGMATTTPDIDLKADFGRNLAALSRRMVSWLNTPALSLDEMETVLRIFEQRFMHAVVEQQAQAWAFLGAAPVAEPYYVRMAEEYMRCHHLEGMNLTTVSKVCGISGRSLQLGFRKHRGMSPTEFSKIQRLDAARRDLMAYDMAGNVTKIAMKWGFSHLGRFAEDYRKRFYELPSETSQRQRQFDY